MSFFTPSTPSSMKASTIEQARVISVDPEQWTMVVRTTTHGKTIADVPILSIYLHQSNGEGIHCMPEPGCIVYIARPSDADAACIPLLFGGAADGKASFRGNRSSMNPGDIFLYTRDDNGIRIKRGGTTEISSSPLAKTVYTYYNNTVTTVAENFQVKSLGSNIEVETDLPEENTEGKFGSRITLKSREYVDTAEDVVSLSLGRVDPTAPTDDTAFVYDLRVSDTYDRSINKDGDLVSSYNNSVYNYTNTEQNYTTATHTFSDNTRFDGPMVSICPSSSVTKEPALKATQFQTDLAIAITAIQTFATATATFGGAAATFGGVQPPTPASLGAFAAAGTALATASGALSTALATLQSSASALSYSSSKLEVD